MANIEARITDVTKVDKRLVDRILAAGKTPTWQFSERCYSKATLSKIDKLCKEYGSKLEVRFYGHYSEGFDASVLKHLPNVSWLSVDCLHNVTNLSALSELPGIQKLSLGIYLLDDPHVLGKLKLAKLEMLSIEATKKKYRFVSASDLRAIKGATNRRAHNKHWRGR
jgi:protein phosphatase 1 regulatory subunit 7